MAKIIDIVVPDLGDFEDVEVIEVLVATGNVVDKEDGLITLETDKAAMDVPAPESGVVEELTVAVGDRVNTGSVIGKLRVSVLGSETHIPASQRSGKEGPFAPMADGSARWVDPPGVHCAVIEFVWGTFIRVLRGLIDLRRARHFEGLMRALGVVLVPPEIEGVLVASDPSALEFSPDIQMQALVCSVVLRASGAA